MAQVIDSHVFAYLSVTRGSSEHLEQYKEE